LVWLKFSSVLNFTELHPIDGAVLVNALAGRRLAVKGHQHVDQRVHVGLGQLASGQHLGPEQPLVELAHRDDPVDDLALALEGELVAVEGDRRRLQVDRRGEAAVELDLGPAVELAQGDGGEVEEAEVDRFFELVDVLTGQEDRGDVGLEEPHPVDRVWVKGGIGERRDELGVVNLAHVSTVSYWRCEVNMISDFGLRFCRRPAHS
jgi:hypothetical protein